MKRIIGLILSPIVLLMVLAGVQRSNRLPAVDGLLNDVIKFIVNMVNRQRREIGNLDYILISLPESLPALPESGRAAMLRRLLNQSAQPPSLLELANDLRRIGEDPRPKGVILHLRGLSMPGADLDTLRDMLLKLKERGKRLVVISHIYDTATYYVASAADDLLLQTGGDLMTLGLAGGVIFLKDALDWAGLEMDAVQITPYKTALDTFARSDISPEMQANLDWIFDARYDQIVNTIATARGQEANKVRAMFDHAPHGEATALEQGYVDAVMNHEGLPAYLGTDHIIPWDQAVKALPIKWIGKPDKVVAVLPLSGMIVDGESRRAPGNIPIPLPLAGEDRMGSMTVVQQVRALMQDRHAAAVVLYIDSGGGSSTASEMMAAALAELAQDRPVVAYMNNVAASGGYYIATPAHYIVAQPNTITGSIGVIVGKLTNNALMNKLRVNVVEFLRGENASYVSSSQRWTDSQRTQVRGRIEDVYAQFIDRVAASRQMSAEAVNAIGGGRIWMATQAVENGLIDEVGGLDVAIRKARELAGLPEDTPAILYMGRGKPLGPQLAEEAAALNPAAGLTYARENLESIFDATNSQMLMPLWFQD